MKKTLLLLALLLAPQTIEALSIQCEGIALSTGVQCKKKIALKHNTSLCHHHKYTNHLEAEKINFNNIDTTKSNNNNWGFYFFGSVLLLSLIIFLVMFFTPPKYYPYPAQ